MIVVILVVSIEVHACLAVTVESTCNTRMHHQRHPVATEPDQNCIDHSLARRRPEIANYVLYACLSVDYLVMSCILPLQRQTHDPTTAAGRLIGLRWWPLPSRISKISIFGHVTVIGFNIWCRVPIFIEIGRFFTEIWRYNDFQMAAVRHLGF